MQRADHHDAEATELAARVDAGAAEITELRARAAVAGREHRGDRGAAGRDRRRGRRERARIRGAGAPAGGAARDAGGGARSSWKRRGRRDRGRAREHRAPGGRAGRAPCSGATIWRRGSRAWPPRRRRPASGWRCSIGEERRLRDEIDGLAARVDDGAGARAARPKRGWPACAAEMGRGELELETLREEAHRRRSRLASLTEIQDRYERFQKGVRAIMQEHRAAGGGDGIKARGRRHRAAAPGAGDRRRGGAGRAAGQRHRRLARGGRRGDPVPQAHARGPVVVHSARAAGQRAARPGRL